jgi:hypothetical protein
MAVAIIIYISMFSCLGHLMPPMLQVSNVQDAHLSSSARNEEPLVNARINRSWCELLVSRDVIELIWGNPACRLLDHEVGG